MGENKPTLKTLANATGLAITTVSRALKDAPEIAIETRERVRQAAETIGYVPDRAAQRLRTGRTNVIAFILEPHEEMLGFGTRMISGMTEAFRGTQYHLVVMPQFEGADPVAPVRHIIRNRLADGIVFCRTQPLDLRVRMLLEADFPFISHGRTELASPHPFVDFDNFEFAADAVRRLVARGSRKIALINAPQPFTFQQHLLHGFMTAVRETGLEYEVPRDINISSPADEIYDHVKAGIEAGVDGFVCPGETSALAVLAALADGGRIAGRHVHVVAKQTTPLFNQVRPQVDLIYEDLNLAGFELGTRLLRRIGGERAEGLQHLLHGERRFLDR